MKAGRRGDARKIKRYRVLNKGGQQRQKTYIPPQVVDSSCKNVEPLVNCDPPLVGCTGPILGSVPVCMSNGCSAVPMPITVCAQDPSFDRGWPAVVPNFMPYGQSTCSGIGGQINNNYGPPPFGPLWPALLPCTTPYPIPAWTMQ